MMCVIIEVFEALNKALQYTRHFQILLLDIIKLGFRDVMHY
jgi:hypothetical protein